MANSALPAHLSSLTIFDYLRHVDYTTLDELYCHPPTCLVVFRELPDLSKHIVSRLLFVEQPIPKSIVTGWVEKHYQNQFAEASKALSDLRVWHSVDGNVTRGSWTLNKRYQESLRISLYGGGKPLLGDQGCIPADKSVRNIDHLSSYAAERWEAILHFMVGSESAEVGTIVKDILLLSNLMKEGGCDSSLGITKYGFQFLLMSRSAQVKLFMVHYFNYIKTNKKNLVAALQFVFQLGFLSVLKSYPVDALNAPQQEVLQNMRELGLAYQRKRTAPRFQVTPLAFGLATGSRLCVPEGSSQTPAFGGPLSIVLPTGVSDTVGVNSVGLSLAAKPVEVGYLILETNFRLYAYTDSHLKTALLSLFSKIRARFPNLVVADITRDSVREALFRGITSGQIISYLIANAHPDMLTETPVLPPTLTDQLRLWELERDRFTFQEGCLYEQFSRSADFEIVRDFAKNINVLLWENPERRLMVVSKNGHEDVRKFCKQKRPV